MSATTTDNPRIAIYQSANGEVAVRLSDDTIWLSLQQIADLFGRDKSVISRHLRNVFQSEELLRTAKPIKSSISISTPSSRWATG